MLGADWPRLFDAVQILGNFCDPGCVLHTEYCSPWRDFHLAKLTTTNSAALFFVLQLDKIRANFITTVISTMEVMVRSHQFLAALRFPPTLLL